MASPSLVGGKLLQQVDEQKNELHTLTDLVVSRVKLLLRVWTRYLQIYSTGFPSASKQSHPGASSGNRPNEIRPR